MKNPRRIPPPAGARIVIVDDHPLVRERLTHVIEEEGGMIVCGEAESVSEALQVIGTTRPQLAIVDLSLKDSHGLELVKELAAAHPKVKILIVSLHDPETYATRAFRAGAHGYMSKQDATRNVLQAIQVVLAGKRYLSRRAAVELIALQQGEPTGEMDAITRLSDREMQVFEAIGEHMRAGDIARQLGLGISTVETYLARIRGKLGVSNWRELLAVRAKWCGRKSPAPPDPQP